MKNNKDGSFLNPFKSRKSNIIEELEAAIKQAKEEIALKHEACESLAHENTQLREQVKSLESENVLLKNRTDQLEKELAENGDIEKRLEEFDRKLSSVEAMKANYEKRINALQANLIAAKARLAKKENYDLLDYIDMNEEVNSIPLDKSRNSADETKWDLMREEIEDNQVKMGDDSQKKKDLDEKKIDFVTEPPVKPVKKYDKKIPGVPDKLPENSSTDDWLVSLPDDL